MDTLKQFIGVLMLAILFIQCEEEPPDPVPPPSSIPIKNSEKKILSFSFKDLVPVVHGHVDHSNFMVLLKVPFGVDVSGLVPTISISLKSEISPASGIPQDFSSPVFYTVQAEDGSSEVYQVAVEMETENEEGQFVLDPYEGPTTLEPGDELQLSGSGFTWVSDLQLILIDEMGTEIHLALLQSSDDLVRALLPEDLPGGEYTVKVLAEDQSETLSSPITIVSNKLEIVAVSPAWLFVTESLNVTGKFILETGNQVMLISGSDAVPLEVISESSSSITAKIPQDTPEGEYTLTVISGTEEATWASLIMVYDKLRPYIESTNKDSYTFGETITISGKDFNINIPGEYASVSIIFSYYGGGISFTRIPTTRSEDGSTVTYTLSAADFAPGQYQISVLVAYGKAYSSNIYGPIEIE